MPQEIWGTGGGALADIEAQGVRAQTQGQQIKNQDAQLTLQNRIQSADILQRAAVAHELGDPTNPAEFFSKAGSTLVERGQVETGMATLEHGVKLQQEQASAAHSQALAKSEQLLMDKAELDQVEGWMLSIPDNNPAEASKAWDAIRLDFLNKHKGPLDPITQQIMNSPYSPELKKRMLTGTQAGRSQIESQFKMLKNQLDLEKEKAEVLRTKTQALLNLQRQETEENKRLTGGKPGTPTVPTKDLQDQAYKALVSKFGSDLDLNDKKYDRLPFEIASRANQLMKQQHLNASEALNAAIGEHKELETDRQAKAQNSVWNKVGDWLSDTTELVRDHRPISEQLGLNAKPSYDPNSGRARPAASPAANSPEALAEKLLPHVITAESGGHPEAVSDAGAMGLGQLMPGTAKQEGVTDPFDAKQNLEGSRSFLTKLLKKYGDPYTALVAYNWKGESTDPSKLDQAPKESQDYANKILRSSGLPEGRQTPNKASGQAPKAERANDSGTRSDPLPAVPVEQRQDGIYYRGFDRSGKPIVARWDARHKVLLKDAE